MTVTAEHIATTVVAEDAPIGVQLWPTTRPEAAPNFTLAEVQVITRKGRDAHNEWTTELVCWTYENGNERWFRLGEQVAIRIVK